MPLSSSQRPPDDVAELLSEGIRYERGGVSERARACFEEVTRRWLEDPAVAAEAWWRLANQHRLHSHWVEALDSARAGAALARQYGLPNHEADALNIEGAIWMTRGDYTAARPLFERTLELAQTSSTRAKALQNLGGIAGEERAFDEAERLFAESRVEYAKARDLRGEAVSLLNIGRLQMERGDLAPARETLEGAVQSARVSGDLEMYAAALLNLGMVLSELHCVNDAEERITTAYGQFTIADIAVQRVRCLIQLARLAVQRNDPATARVCLTHARDVAAGAQLPREMRLIVEQLETLGSA
ncbi:MAG TPA: tetratricopeptide repeat protein [Gemmatimonadaceae bacterium]